MSFDDPYVYPGTGVLKNKLDIRDAVKLERFERLAVRKRLLDIPSDVPMSVEGYRSIHQHLFQDVYEWAGETRSINLQKVVSEQERVHFETGPLVAVNLRRFFGELNADNCLRNLDRNTFSFRAAVYLADLNQIHPFREGNGRTQRHFLKCLGRQAGHELDLRKIEPKRWIEASKKSFEGKHNTMEQLILRSITGREQERRSQSKESILTKPRRRRRRQSHERDGGRER